MPITPPIKLKPKKRKNSRKCAKVHYKLTVPQVKSLGGLGCILCMELHKDKIVNWDELLSEGSEKESASKLIQVVGKIQVLAIAELKSLFPSWLLAPG